jgi:hypothetical protein
LVESCRFSLGEQFTGRRGSVDTERLPSANGTSMLPISHRHGRH